MIEVIVKTIKDKCPIYRQYEFKNAALIEFLVYQFANKFIIWHDLDKHACNTNMWLYYNKQLKERWDILRPFWLSYLVLTKSLNSIKLKWYLFKDRIKAKKYSFIESLTGILKFLTLYICIILFVRVIELIILFFF